MTIWLWSWWSWHDKGLTHCTEWARSDPGKDAHLNDKDDDDKDNDDDDDNDDDGDQSGDDNDDADDDINLGLCFSCYVCAAVWTNCGHRVGPEKDPVQLFKIKSKGGNWWWLPWWLQCIAMVTKCFFRNLEIEVTLALPDLSEAPCLVQGAETLISDNKRLKKSHIIVREG